MARQKTEQQPTWRISNVARVRSLARYKYVSCLPFFGLQDSTAQWQPFFDLEGRFMWSHIRGLSRARDFNFVAQGLIAIKLKMFCGKQPRPAGQA